MSWKPAIDTGGTGRFYDNGLRFATYQEAFDYARSLANRWSQVKAFSAIESKDPASSAWINGQLECIE